MIEWGILKCSSSCSCNEGKHEGSVQRQDIIHLPKKNKNKKKVVDTISTFRWKPEISDFAAVQGCERHTRLPLSLKCAATEAMLSGQKKNKSERPAIGSP